ncbi:MAG TPA: ubiquitin-like domain-containing protein [Actinomycetota bacterium]|nr:ubiquitin-like domain-containing protein [Actinomycetota bacterium]
MLSATIVSGAWAKDVTLVIDGRSHDVRTRSTSVEDLLSDQGVPLSIGLQVEPPPATTLADGMTVYVSPPPGVPANGFSASVTSTGVGVWVVERPGTGSFGKANSGPGEASTSAAGVGPSGVTVRAVVTGKVHDVSTNAETTGALLMAMGIQPDADDRVVPPPSTPLHDGMTVRYDRVSTTTHQMTLPIQMPVDTHYTSSLSPGHMVVLSHGSTGTERAAVAVRSVNGSVVSRRIVSRSVLAPPVPEVRLSAPYSMTDGTLREPGTGATTETGEASWYDPPWSGLTAAQPWLPFGTHVTVTDLDTGRSVTVVIDDRGPFGSGRIIDLSPEAFSALQPLGHGVLHVSLSW